MAPDHSIPWRAASSAGFVAVPLGVGIARAQGGSEPPASSQSLVFPSGEELLKLLGPWADFAAPVALAVLVVTIFALFGLMLYGRSARRLRRKLKDVERFESDIAAALGKPSVSLGDAAAEIREFEQVFRSLDAENAKLRLEHEDDARKMRGGEDERGGVVVATAITALRECAGAIESVQADADFAAIDQALAVRVTIAKATTALLAVAGEADPKPRLADLLKNGHLNSILGLAAFLDAYFADRPKWRHLRVACHCANSAMELMLSFAGIELVLPQLLVVISVDELPGPPSSDRRGVRNIQSVQRKAARLARSLREDQCLIVDCHAPGWISDKLERRAPSVTIFDRSSWT